MSTGSTTWERGRPRPRPILFAVLTCAFASIATAAADPHAHAHGSMAAAPNGVTELAADATFDQRGKLWTVHKISGHIAVSSSADCGRAWSSPVLVTPSPEPTDAGSDARPKIAIGPREEIYVTWTKPLAQPFTGQITFSRSLDGGRTFHAPVVVHRDRQIITHRFDALAVNRAGQVFVAWIDKRDLAAASAAGLPYRGAALYFAVSDDRGASFRGDYKVADHTCECCRIAVTPRGDGTIAAMWRHIVAPNIRDHASATLHPDGTTSGLRRATFNDWRIDACPHHGPAIAVDAIGRTHAVWFSAAPESRGAFYGRLRAGGIDGGRPIAAPPAGHADIAIDGQRVAIAWKDFENGRTRLRGMMSEDGGDSWRQFDLCSTAGASSHLRVLSYGGRFYVFWNTAEHPLQVSALDEATTDA